MGSYRTRQDVEGGYIPLGIVTEVEAVPKVFPEVFQVFEVGPGCFTGGRRWSRCCPRGALDVSAPDSDSSGSPQQTGAAKKNRPKYHTALIFYLF